MCDLVLGNLSVCSVHLCAESRRTVGVVAECALSVTNDSRSGAVMWPATKSHSQGRSLPNYNENPSTSIDRLRAPELLAVALLLCTELYTGFVFRTSQHTNEAFEVYHSRK